MAEPSTPREDARYRSLFEQHPDGVYEFDLQGRFVAGNDALAELTGYGIDDLLGHTFLEIVHPDDAEQAREEFLATVAGQTRSYDATGRRRDGGLFHISITNVPIVIDDEVVGVYGIARDVSETVAARQALERSEARFRQMFHSAGVGVALTTLTGTFARANPAFLSMTGFSHDVLAARDLESITHPDDRGRLVDALRLLIETSPPSVAVQVRCLRQDGSTAWLRLSLTLLEWSDDTPPFVMVTSEDLTALRRTDERLEQSQSLVRMAGQVARIGGWQLDLASGEMRWSAEIHDVLGVPRGEPPSLEASLSSYPPEHRRRVVAALDACGSEGTPFELEVEVRARQGRRMWVRLIGEPEHDRDHEVVGIRGALQDVDQHKQAEQETRELADRLTATLESITDAVYTLDRHWRVTYLNSRGAELVGRSRSELLGRVLWDEFPDLRGTVVEETYRRVAATGAPEVLEEYHYAPLDRWFELNVYATDGGVTVYFRDVSARREARLQLREREARLVQQARLLDQARDAIVVRDRTGRITYWNQSAEEVFGWSGQEALGQVERDLLFADPDDFDAAEQATYEHGEWTGELTKVDRLGREVVVEARWTLVRDEDEQSSVLAIMTDVTERRRLEQQVLQAQRMDSLGTLAGGIAHDLNNALSPVLMSGRLLAADETDPERRELLDIIVDSTQRGAEMVQQVLSFARGIDGQRVAVDLVDTVADLRRLTRDTFPKNVTLHTNLAPDLWPVLGDPTQLHQVLLNLCVNARDAMPEGGTLSVNLTNLVVDETRQSTRRELEPGPYVRVTVADTGEGMTGEVLDRIFEPFYTTKSKESGTGLGLSTSLGIIESHGGSLEAHSRPGIGSIFTLDLPAAPAPAAAEIAPATSDTARGDGQLVLLVDDEPAVRHLARVTLERAGYTVLPATDGLDAIEQARRHLDELALVITDLMMPHMDGATAMEHVREMRADLPVVAVSGLRAELERDARRLGTSHMLRKPFTPHELLEVAAAALGSRIPT